MRALMIDGIHALTNNPLQSLLISQCRLFFPSKSFLSRRLVYPVSCFLMVFRICGSDRKQISAHDSNYHFEISEPQKCRRISSFSDYLDRSARKSSKTICTSIFSSQLILNNLSIVLFCCSLVLEYLSSMQ